MAKTVEVSIYQFFEHMNDHIDRMYHEYEEGEYSEHNNVFELDQGLYDYGILDFVIIKDGKLISELRSIHLSVDNLQSIKEIGEGVINLGLSEDESTVRYLFLRKFQKSGITIQIGMLVDANKFFEKITKPLELTALDFVWVLDSDGSLIYHPLHSEMLMRNIFSTEEDCMECHNSFNMQKKILKNQSGSEIYFIADESNKIMAYRHLKYMNIDWSIVVSTMYDRIIDDYSEQFKFITLTSIIVFIIIATSFTANYFLNIKRIRETEKRNRIEKEKEIQIKLEQTSKLATLGELVDTVAHEVNTPIGIIRTHVDSLKMDKRFKDVEELEIINRQTHRLNSYTKNLLNFSRRLPFNPVKNDIVQVINECTSILGHRFRKKGIKLTKRLESKIPPIKFDKIQMEQVLINILNNAIDAAPYNGNISISAKYSSEVENEKHSSKLEISISNDGPDIPEENIEKIFDAFFTTKKPGKGTGLGLYISKNIINRHKGRIFASSSKGLTIFTIIIPA